MAITKRVIIFVFIVLVVVSIIVTSIFVKRSEDKSKSVVVNTTSGSIKGVKIESVISDFYAFFSIPYARSPIGHLRFKAPHPVSPWKDIHDGSIEGPACIQPHHNHTSEDCLTLSVYTSDYTGKGKAVYVWVHGGSLKTGSAKMADDGPHYLMKHDLVVVSVQFRLGMLGFLNLGSEDAPGNMALADVIEALKWVQTNIHNFGGDPTRVTLGGLSSGGIMVHALLISPKSQGLFNQVIISSGTALSYRLYNDDIEHPIRNTKQVLNLNDTSNEGLLQYLRNIPHSELLQITQDVEHIYPSGYASYFPYALSRDYFDILPDNPLYLIYNNSYINKPMLIGYTSDEGIRLEKFMDRLDFVNDHFQLVVPWSKEQFSIDEVSPEKDEAARIIKDFYFGNKELSRETFSEYVRLVTDSWYGHVTDYLIRLQGSMNYTAPIYYYIFGVDGAYNHQKIWYNYTTPGASHADDLGYIWNVHFLENIHSSDEFSNMARTRMVTMWSNFIKSGNPTPDEVDSKTLIKWSPVKYPNVQCLLVNKTLSMMTDPFRERLLFWQRWYDLEEL